MQFINVVPIARGTEMYSIKMMTNYNCTSVWKRSEKEIANLTSFLILCWHLGLFRISYIVWCRIMSSNTDDSQSQYCLGLFDKLLCNVPKCRRRLSIINGLYPHSSFHYRSFTTYCVRGSILLLLVQHRHQSCSSKGNNEEQPEPASHKHMSL